MPFRWTINPYRGCTHSCVYCLAGDTPVLLGDGTYRPIKELGVGDEIFGTARDRGHRRYVRTTVRDHWTTVKPAFRVVLEDGTQLVTSGDHRFLSRRGWRYVTNGSGRPHLTLNDSLMGTGQRADQQVTAGQMVKTFASLTVAAIEPLGVELPMYDITTGTGDFIADWRRLPQLLRAADAHVPRLQRRRGLRAGDRRQGQRAGVAAGRTGAAVVGWGARCARHEHRPVPVGRGALPADGGDLGGDAGCREPVFDPDQVAAAAAGSAADASDQRADRVQRRAVDPDA